MDHPKNPENNKTSSPVHGSGHEPDLDAKGGHHHHILSNKLALTIFGSLIGLTVVTVITAQMDFGWFNFPLALILASTKAVLVCMYFMGLKYDSKENVVMFSTSFLFLAIFIVFTAIDIFSRGDVYVTKEKLAAIEKAQQEAAGSSGAAAPKFKRPWVETSELIAHAKPIFEAQCASCHGSGGKGDGPAGQAFNPPPRNFAVSEGWKTGRKPSQIFKTLKEGLGSMPAFASLPAEDRWALVHYVRTMGAHASETDSPADLLAVGVDPSKENVEEKVAATIPVARAMALMAEPVSEAVGFHALPAIAADAPIGAKLYGAYCLNCHGDQGKGGVRVKNLGASPKAYLTTSSMGTYESMKSPEVFVAKVQHGIPGTNLMPSFGHLSVAQIIEIYQYLK